MTEMKKMSQLELCKKVDKILCVLYDHRNDGDFYLEWSEVVSPRKEGGLLDMKCLTPFLEETPDVPVLEADLNFFKEFESEGHFYNHQDDNWQETIYVSRHKPTGHLVGVRSIYSSYGDGTPYEESDGLTHCFPARPIKSWDYGAYDPTLVVSIVAEEVKND